MKTFVETIRGARFIGLFLMIALLSALGLMLLGNGERGSTGGTELESRLERLLEGIDGVGDADVMITVDDQEKPAGVAVVVGGSLNVRVTLEIQSAIRALLDIDLKRIRIIGRGGVKG